MTAAGLWSSNDRKLCLRAGLGKEERKKREGLGGPRSWAELETWVARGRNWPVACARKTMGRKKVSG
jgi:hypothetical protein